MSASDSTTGALDATDAQLPIIVAAVRAKRRGLGPSMDELASCFGLGVDEVEARLKALRRRDLVVYDRKGSTSIATTERGRAAALAHVESLRERVAS